MEKFIDSIKNRDFIIKKDKHKVVYFIENGVIVFAVDYYGKAILVAEDLDYKIIMKTLNLYFGEEHGFSIFPLLETNIDFMKSNYDIFNDISKRIDFKTDGKFMYGYFRIKTHSDIYFQVLIDYNYNVDNITYNIEYFLDEQ